MCNNEPRSAALELEYSSYKGDYTTLAYSEAGSHPGDVQQFLYTNVTNVTGTIYRTFSIFQAFAVVKMSRTSPDHFQFSTDFIEQYLDFLLQRFHNS